MKKLFGWRKFSGLAAIAMLLLVVLAGFDASSAPAADAAQWGCGGQQLFWPASSSVPTILVQKNDDLIYYHEESNGNPNLIQVVLTTGTGQNYPDQNVTWWKGAEVFDTYDYYNTILVSGAYTQDTNHGPSVATLNLTRPANFYCLTLSKAKTFGIHTQMYNFNLNGKAGKTIYIHWSRDSYF